MTPPGPTPESHPLPRLADALTELGAQLRDIGDEIRVLRTATPAHPDPQPAPTPAEQSFSPRTSPPPPAPPPPWFPPPPFAPPPPFGPPMLPTPPAHRRSSTRSPSSATGVPRPAAPPAGPSAWDRLSQEGAGSRVLAWVGGGITLAGLVLLLVLAVQRGYVGPLPRVLLGAALATGLVAVGVLLHRTPGGRTGALAVAATGFAGLFFDIVAATSIYPFLPVPVGLVAGLGVAGAGAVVALRWDSQVFGAFAVAGSAITAPVLTGGFDAVLVGFLLVLQIASVPVQLTRRWPVLGAVAGLPPILVVLLEVTIARTGGGGPDAATVVALCLVTGLLQIAFATASAVRAAGTEVATGLLLAAAVPTLVGVSLVSRPHGALVVGVLAAALLIVWASQRVSLMRVPRPFADAAGAGAAIAIFEATCLAFDGGVRSVALLGAGALLAVLAERMGYAAALVPASVFAGVGAVLGLVGPLRPRYLLQPPIGEVAHGAVAGAATGGVLLATTAAALAWASARVWPGGDPQAARLRWTVAGGVALYGASLTILSAGLAVVPDERGFLVGHALVTVSWTVAALVLLLRRLDSTPFRVAGLVLVAATVAKLVLFDLASLSGIPRVLAFLVAGLVLLAAGAKYASLVSARGADRSTAS